MKNFKVDVIVETPRFVVARNIPEDPADPVWYTVTLSPRATLGDLDAMREYLPERGDVVTLDSVMRTEDGNWYFDLTAHDTIDMRNVA